ncbi:MAG: hypothetical protein OWQ59_09610 [Alicyclobacillaceae bacterium]|jgi:hypothetical protein|uniref:hypothetical protein n=1 Tax=Alicyclobacillus sp. SP_1 TaxID=2942475 RepID=UPI002157F491|nr:hypothetical protein [Alicyclobacillus sp. SP_1]MCY0888698.1 hypothetical protein [Alicyclobacillaceae bacterium]MCY0895599.1 hypothetical protein [Alicyclobacillaceae bacterium]
MNKRANTAQYDDFCAGFVDTNFFASVLLAWVQAFHSEAQVFHPTKRRFPETLFALERGYGSPSSGRMDADVVIYPIQAWFAALFIDSLTIDLSGFTMGGVQIRERPTFTEEAHRQA